MDSTEKTQEEIVTLSSSNDNWRERIFIPTLLAGIVGAGVGALSRHRKVHGLENISASYASNFAIVTGCYCGAREFVRANRTSKPDDLLNSVIGGFASGAILGCLQGGQAGAVRYSVIFAVAGTAADYAALKLKPTLKSFFVNSSKKDGNWLRLPEWSPIQALDEEALAAKRAREQQLNRNLHKLNKEES